MFCLVHQWKTGFPEKNKLSTCLGLSLQRFSKNALWWYEKKNNPLMRSLPQVVFTAAFLTYPSPIVVCLHCLSAALELCSSVLPPKLFWKRELALLSQQRPTLSLDFLTNPNPNPNLPSTPLILSHVLLTPTPSKSSPMSPPYVYIHVAMYQFLLNTLDTIISVSELKYTRYISHYKNAHSVPYYTSSSSY